MTGKSQKECVTRFEAEIIHALKGETSIYDEKEDAQKKDVLDEQQYTAPENWTPEQEQQLQHGLQIYPSSLGPDQRWSSIANEVTGKSQQDCVARFESMLLSTLYTATDGADNEATAIKATRKTYSYWTDQEDSIIMDAVINSLEKPFTRWVDLSQ